MVGVGRSKLARPFVGRVFGTGLAQVTWLACLGGRPDDPWADQRDGL